MRKFFNISFFAGVCVLLAGCKTATQSPRQAFLATLGSERSNCVQVYEVSTESLRAQEDEVLKATKIATHGIREAISQCSADCPAVSERLERIEHIAEVLHNDRIKVIKRLENEYDPKTDTILFCHFRSNHSRELAWVIMRGAKVKTKIVFAEGSIQTDDP